MSRSRKLRLVRGRKARVTDRLPEDLVVKIGGKTYPVKVVPALQAGETITLKDAEMDVRATQAVRAAIAKAEICKKPVAKYDIKLKKAYVEYADGERKYVN